MYSAHMYLGMNSRWALSTLYMLPTVYERDEEVGLKRKKKNLALVYIKPVPPKFPERPSYVICLPAKLIRECQRSTVFTAA